ncbi:MAG: hypothetical protein GXO15_03195, partial [Crenarchaeota archaeon]|nr:hypothetical protein [Thermoproteota archaeon]
MHRFTLPAQAPRGRVWRGGWPLEGRGARARLLYASLIRVEELPLYHVCPGEAAARLVAAGSPWRCRVCRWSQAASTEGLVVREALLGDVL